MLKSLIRITAGVAGGLALFLLAFALVADGESKSTEAVTIERDAIPHYRELASELGLDYDSEYSYRDWRLEALDQFKVWQPAIGDCGTWAKPKECERESGYIGLELLYCSHGRDVTNNCDFRGEGPFLETVYLTKHDVTLLTLFRHDDDGVHTHVELLKLAEGRQADLHKS